MGVRIHIRTPTLPVRSPGRTGGALRVKVGPAIPYIYNLTCLRYYANYRIPEHNLFVQTPQEDTVMNVPHGPGPLVAATRDISRRSVVVGFGFAGIAAALAAAGWKVDVLAQDASPAPAQPMNELNALLVVYNHPEDTTAFQDYLWETHIPIVYKVPGLHQLFIHSDLTTTEFVPGDIYQLGTVVFASQADLETALGSAEGQAAFADVGNFATGGFSAYLVHFTPVDIPGMATPMA